MKLYYKTIGHYRLIIERQYSDFRLVTITVDYGNIRWLHFQSTVNTPTKKIKKYIIENINCNREIKAEINALEIQDLQDLVFYQMGL
jgi:hypothetical protein